ncbi:MAG: hypothetical protein USCAAHI_01108 [Beijerinckiaceae bacterium]|nr:MAG: hypothetical protein USCAAHI_01108 [Beijerinckiaceae bacterium]
MWSVARVVRPEWLDSLPPDDPRAGRSRRDLRRINAWMQQAGIMAGVLASHCSKLRELYSILVPAMAPSCFGSRGDWLRDGKGSP